MSQGGAVSNFRGTVQNIQGNVSNYGGVVGNAYGQVSIGVKMRKKYIDTGTKSDEVLHSASA
jgi:hypothetical protein